MGAKMTEAIDQVLQAALALSDADQRVLLAALEAAVVERRKLPFDESWLAEIKRRSAELDTGTVERIPWAEVKACVRREVGGGG
jgi:Putative addiction module component